MPLKIVLKPSAMNRNRLIVILIFLTTACAHLFGQTGSDYHSLHRRAYSGKTDTGSINALILLTKRFMLTCNDSIPAGIKYAMDARNRSLKINFPDGIVRSNILIGDILRFIRDYSAATDYYFQALKFNDKTAIPNTLGAYQGLGLIYLVQERWEDAITYFKKAGESIQGTEAKQDHRPPYLTGYCQVKLGMYEQARINLETALKIAVAGNKTGSIKEIKISLANALSGLGKHQEALDMFESLQPQITTKDPIGKSHLYYGMALTYRRMIRPEKALEYALKAHSIHTEEADWSLIRESARLLGDIYNDQKDFASAYQYLRKYLQALDTISNRDILPKIAVSQARMEFKKTEDRMNEELLLGKQKRLRLNLLLGFSGLILAVLLIAFFSVRKERQKSEKLLLNILPQDTAMELKKTGRVVPRMHNSVSIMFCDFVGFTRIIENLSPEQLVTILDYYFSGFDHIMEKYGIEKIKTIGDAYMCVAGLRGETDHAKKMVQACMELVEFVEQSLHRFDHALQTGFNIRVGIHSGSVVSGVVGKNKYAFDIWGDDVNVAARMEQHSEPGRINISRNTWELVHRLFPTESRGMLPAKNKGEMEMYFVG